MFKGKIYSVLTSGSGSVVGYLRCNWQGTLSHPEDDTAYQGQVSMTKY